MAIHKFKHLIHNNLPHNNMEVSKFKEFKLMIGVYSILKEVMVIHHHNHHNHHIPTNLYHHKLEECIQTSPDNKVLV